MFLQGFAWDSLETSLGRFFLGSFAPIQHFFFHMIVDNTVIYVYVSTDDTSLICYGVVKGFVCLQMSIIQMKLRIIKIQKRIPLFYCHTIALVRWPVSITQTQVKYVTTLRYKVINEVTCSILTAGIAINISSIINVSPNLLSG